MVPVPVTMQTFAVTLVGALYGWRFGALTIAADFESGFDFVKMFELGGGMPTRVTVPEARFDEVMHKLGTAVEASLAARSGAAPTRFG